MTKASDNLFPSVLLQNTSNSAITTPTPWNAQRLFFDADGTLKKVDSNDTVTAVGGSGGTITFGGVSSTDTVTVASNFAVSDQGGGTARLDIFFPASGGGTDRLLGFTRYEDSSDSSDSVTSSTLSDFDATNLTVTFDGTGWDTVVVRVTAMIGAAVQANWFSLGLRESTTTVADERAIYYNSANGLQFRRYTTALYVTGVTDGSHTYKLAGKSANNTDSITVYTGPNNGDFIMEVWGIA